MGAVLPVLSVLAEGSTRQTREAEPVVLVETQGGRTASLVHQDSGLQYHLANGKV